MPWGRCGCPARSILSRDPAPSAHQQTDRSERQEAAEPSKHQRQLGGPVGRQAPEHEKGAARTTARAEKQTIGARDLAVGLEGEVIERPGPRRG